MHDLFGTLPPDIGREVDDLGIHRHVAGGGHVYRQGDTAREMYQLLTGCVRLCNYSYGGKEVEIGRFHPGDCFGEMGIIDGMPRVSHAVANEDSRLRVLSKADFDVLYH